tara:strand:+ start:93 stop:1577 length:1485 start_codon:yes stop_codon:yes gene_type:complete
MNIVSYSSHFAALAKAAPASPMVTVVSTTGSVVESVTWAEAETRSTVLAHALKHAGCSLGDYVTIALPNSVDFVISALAAWKLGAVPQPVSAGLPARELDAIVELADSRAVIGVAPERFEGRICWPAAMPPAELCDVPIATPLPDVVSPAWKAPTSGGSTGRPKLIVSGDPSSFDTEDPGVAAAFGFRPGGTTLMPGPLYHNGPFIWAFTQLREGGHVVLLERFDASTTLHAIGEFAPEVLYLVPTMMSRIWKLPASERAAADTRSLTHVWHLAAPCPAWLKHAWLEWLGPERLWELYGGTEGQSATIVSGVEWLAREGTVGRPISGEMCIMDAAGHPVAAGVVGEVYMRADPGRVTYHYRGAEPKTLKDGWESLGDIGWMDEDGFLYLVDRKTDMILSGGANIYPAEIEAALELHPAVSSSAVIGLPDEDLGQRVHAIVQADAQSAADLLSFLGEHLARYKLPRSVEYVAEPLRDDAGKVRRSALLEARTARA